jgi:hypothetical protein
MTESQKTRLADVGQVWIPWDPDSAFGDERLARAVSEFEPVATPAGRAAARWLKEDALANHGLTVTYLALVDLRVEGFYAMCAGEVELPTSQRRALGLSHPRQGVALVVWLARRQNGLLSGLELLAHASRRARLVSDIQGLAGLAVDPFDEDTAEVWRAPPYEFLKSNTTLPNGNKRLWRPLAGRERAQAPSKISDTTKEGLENG